MNSTTQPGLSLAQINSYHATGFVIVRGVFQPDAIASLSAEADRLFHRADLIDSDNIRCRWQNCVETEECRFDCFDPVIDISPVCAQIARDPNLISIISSLYGERACLFKDKLIFKPSGAKGYALHQDYISWKSFPKSFVTAIVAIDSSDASNGATEVFSGCHTQGCMTPEDGMYHELPIHCVDASKAVMLDLAPGDVAIFSGFTPHRSAPNKSQQSRRLLYLSFNSESDGGDRRDAHYQEFKGWLQERYAEHGKTNTFFR